MSAIGRRSPTHHAPQTFGHGTSPCSRARIEEVISLLNNASRLANQALTASEYGRPGDADEALADAEGEIMAAHLLLIGRKEERRMIRKPTIQFASYPASLPNINHTDP